MVREKIFNLRKKKKPSSNQWLLRHMNDPYVHKAQAKGYRCRSVFKLEEIDKKFRILKPGMHVLDLGCAPGGWCQWTLPLIGKKGFLMGIDLLQMDPLPGMEFIRGDITDPVTQQDMAQAIMARCMQKNIDITLPSESEPYEAKGSESVRLFDVILSDMAPSLTGHAPTDRVQMDGLLSVVWQVAQTWLAPGGALIVKVYHGDMMSVVGGSFSLKKYIKPDSSRPESREIYMVATGFKGGTRYDAV
jgi:23S rRNA (uridine2552-2'-O)-methyltransferase